MSLMRLTKKRKTVLDAIKELMARDGHEPSYQEVADHLGAPKSTVQFHIENLRKAGYLDHGATTLQRGHHLPLLGQVAAGQPIEKLKHDEMIEVPSQFLKPERDHYVLQVEGDSMIEDHICDGDYAVICRQSAVTNGQIVVASIDGESTLKRIYKKRGQVELHPANKNYDPLIVKSPTHFRIEGVLTGVLRSMR